MLEPLCVPDPDEEDDESPELCDAEAEESELLLLGFAAFVVLCDWPPSAPLPCPI